MADEAGIPAPVQVAAPSKPTGLDPTVQLTVRTASPPPPPPVASAPKSRVWVWAGLALFAIAAGGLWYLQPWVAKGLAVTVETVTPSPLMRVLAVNGQIAPLRQVAVKPTVGGALQTVMVNEGDIVQGGDVLAQVDPTQQQAAVRQALAGLDEALVGQATAEASLARAEALGGTITRTALDDARSARQTADQEVARMTAALEQSQIELARYTILAPMTGTILMRDAEVGQVVSTSTALFTLADLEQLVVETDVDEAYAAQVVPNLPAVLQLKGTTEKRDGEVSFVAAQVDADTGGLAIRIAFDAPVTAPVGLTVTANIVVDQQDSAISVPRAAVVTEAAGAAVFVAEEGLAVRRAVTVVDWPADRLEVTTGLAAGDEVITDATGLSDGLAISVPTPAAP